MNRLTEYLECLHRPDTGTMVCRWLREATPAEMRTSYEFLFAEAQGIGSRLWLLDIRRRNNEDPETAQWLMDHYMPTLAAHFGGPTFLAYLLSPAHLVRVDDAAIDIVARFAFSGSHSLPCPFELWTKILPQRTYHLRKMTYTAATNRPKPRAWFQASLSVLKTNIAHSVNTVRVMTSCSTLS